MSEIAAFISQHVFRGEQEIALVSRDGGDWQFLCAKDHSGDTPFVVGVEHMFEKDPSLESLRSLPIGWEAYRSSATDDWEIYEIE